MPQKGTILLHEFDLAYKNLSLQEKTVIDSNHGPFWVNATNATDNTGLLALRLARLLSQVPGTPRLLCLLENETSVIELQAKLKQLVGSIANEVNICTIDGFFEWVINDAVSSGLENKSTLPLSPLENILILKNLVDNFPKNNPLKHFRGDAYHEIAGLEKIFSAIKREGWSIEKLTLQITKHLCELNKEDEEKIEQFEKLKAAVNEFDQYQQLLQQYQRFDKNDLVDCVIKAFEEDKDLLLVYRQKFDYLHIAGYIGAPLTRFLHLLVPAEERPNLLVITREQHGDADPLKDAFHDDTFYNNTNPINWNKVILNNQSPLELLNLPMITRYHSPMVEMAGLVKQVHDLLQKKIAPAKVGILCPDGLYIEKLEQNLIVNNIPFSSSITVNILQTPFIKKIIRLLQYISAEQEIPSSGDELLFEILHFDFYKIPPDDIAALSIEVNSKKYGNNPTSTRKQLKEKSNAPAKDLFDTGINKNLKALSDVLENLIAAAATLPLQQFYDQLIQQALIHDYAVQSSDRDWLIQLLTTFNNFIKNETSQHPGLQLQELSEVLSLMEKEGIPLETSRISNFKDQVQIMQPATFKEQGLDYIFIVGANAPLALKLRWYNSIYDITGTSPLPLHANVLENLVNKFLHSGLNEIAPRLFISFSKYDIHGNALEPASFVSKLVAEHSIPVNEISLSEFELSQYKVVNKPLLQPEIAKSAQTIISPFLQKFVMNVSALNSYLNCPLDFYFKYIIRVPGNKNEAMEFGSAVHYALETFFKKMSGNFSQVAGIDRKPVYNDEFPAASEMVEDFLFYLKEHRANFNRVAYERRKQYGIEVLHNYYEQYITCWNKVVSVERNMRGIRVNGVPLKGKLDKLEFVGNEVNIVDYKTGDIEKALPKMQPPGDHNPAGGDYWRQAVFYKILVDNYAQKEWKVKSVEFDFIEPDKKKVFRKEKILINDPDIETVKQQFTQVWNNIRAHDFYTGCGRPNCHWCNFVKENKLAIAIHRRPEPGTMD